MQEYYDNIDKKDPRSAVAIPKVDDQEISRFGTMILAIISMILVVVTLPFSLCYCVKVVQEYERAVIFRLGRLKQGGASGPGLFFILPCIDKYSCVDLRTVSYEVPPQEMLSRDSVTVSVDAVCFYKVKYSVKIDIGYDLKSKTKSTKLDHITGLHIRFSSSQTDQIESSIN